MTPERKVKARSWRTWKIGIYLPSLRGDLARMRYDVWFYSHLSLTFVKSVPCVLKHCLVKTAGHLPHMASWWQLWGDIMCRSRNQMLVLSRHLWQLYHHLFAPLVTFHRSGLSLDFFITLLARIHWPFHHFPRRTPSSASYFCMAYFILLPFCQRAVKFTT